MSEIKSVESPLNGVFRQLGKGAVAKVVTLPVTAVSTLGTSALIIAKTDSATFGLVALIGSLFMLLPFADLGLGATIVNAVAEARSPDSMAHALVVVRKCVRVLCCSGLLLLTVGTALSLSGGWTFLLNMQRTDPFSQWAPVLAIVPFALSLPMAVGMRILIGDGMNHLVTLLATVGPMVSFLGTLAILKVDLDPLFLSTTPAFGVMSASLLTLFVACRRMKWSMSDIFGRAERLGPVKLWDTAGPMLALSVIVPLSVQFQRYFVAHLDPDSLPEYSLVAQLYFPCYGIVATAAVALWPMFRNAGDPWLLWKRAFASLTLTGIVAFLGFGLLAGPLSTLVSGGEINVSGNLILAFATFLMVMASHQAAAMLLTTPSGLRFQALCAFAMFLVSTFLAWGLTPVVGVAGPVWACVVGVLLAQVLPGVLMARRSKMAKL